MPGRTYREIVSVGDTDIHQVSAAPFGVLSARKGSLAISNSTDGSSVYQNTDGGTTWVLLSGSIFVLRPGEPNPGGNVYATTAAVRDALNNSSGSRILQLDDTYVSPVVLDAGVYGDKDLWVRGLSDHRVPVTILDGALIPAVRYTGQLDITWEGTTPTAVLSGSNPAVFLESGVLATRGAAAGGPMWSVTSPDASLFLGVGGIFIDTGNGPLMDVGAGAGLFVTPQPLGQLDPDTISGDVTALVIGFWYDKTPNIYFPQPSFAGTLLLTFIPFPTYISGGGPTTLDNQAFVVTVDIAAPHTIFLPPISEFPTGYTITFTKFDASGAVATIDAVGWTINGAPTKTLTAQYDSFTIQKHAVGGFASPEWIVISERP